MTHVNLFLIYDIYVVSKTSLLSIAVIWLVIDLVTSSSEVSDGLDALELSESINTLARLYSAFWEFK